MTHLFKNIIFLSLPLNTSIEAHAYASITVRTIRVILNLLKNPVKAAKLSFRDKWQEKNLA